MLELPEFKTPALLLQALTHSSYANEHPGVEHNERLEFLGDAVLKFHLSELLYCRHSWMREGKLSLWRSEMERNSTLVKAAIVLRLGDRHLLRLGEGTKAQGGQQHPKILSGALEAIIGGYHLDSGSEAVHSYVEQLFPYLLMSDQTLS